MDNEFEILPKEMCLAERLKKMQAREAVCS